MRAIRRLSAMAALASGLVVAACGGDENGSDDAQESGPTEDRGTGLLFSHTADSGSLRERGDGDFELVLDNPANVTVFTDRPVRSASSESVDDFVKQWGGRGFEDQPPNAALVLDQEPADSDTVVLELSEPSLDEDSGSLSYTATKVTGDGTGGALPEADAGETPERFGEAHVFVDPSDGETYGLTLDGPASLAFDSPWSPVVASSGNGLCSRCLGYSSTQSPPVEAVVAPNAVRVQGGGELDFGVTGGTGAITGTAEVQSGQKATLQLGNGPEQTLQDGNFSIGG